MSKTWKAVERKIAALLGGERVPITGRTRGSAPDIQHDLFSLEVKHRDKLPEWILEAMEQAEASQRGNQVPMAVLHGKGMKFEDSLAIFRISDIIRLYEQLKEEKWTR